MAQAPPPSGGIARASAGVADNNDCGTAHATHDHALLAAAGAAVAPDAGAGGAHHHLASLAMLAAAAPPAAADSPTHSSLQFHSGPEGEQAYLAAAAAAGGHSGGTMLGALGAASFVPRRDANNNIPCFVQTSALFTNMCGYCGTRSTSGCWRRGWEVAPNRFINLCNKCGLRHKAGKLPAVPEPPPPQSRGRAATSGAAAMGGGASTYTHSADMTSLGAAFDPEHSVGHGAVDPAEAAAAPRGCTNGGGGGGGSGSGGGSASRKRRTPAKPLEPKGSRVGTSLVAEYGSSPEQQHLLAQLLAASGAASAAEAVIGGTLMPGMHADFEEHAEHQRHVAALLQSLADGTAAAAAAAASTAGSGSYAAAAGAAAGASPHGAGAAGAAGLSNASNHLGYGSYYSAGDTAQAVAAVLAAAAAGTGAAPMPGLSGLSSRGFGAPLTLGSISTGHAAQHAADRGPAVPPAAKKRRTTKKGAADGGDGGGGIEAALAAAAALGAAGLMAQPSDDAAAAGDAADALLALHRDSPVASPSKAMLAAAPPPAFTAGASTLTPEAAAIRSTLTLSAGLMGGFNAANTSQVMSPSIDTHKGSAGTLHHFMPPAPHPTGALVPRPQPGASSLAGPHHSHQHPAGTPPLALAHWTSDHLQAWLHSCGCGEAAAALKAAGIDGAALCGLMRVATDAGAARLDDRLRADMGVERVALRLRLVDRIMGDLTGRGSIGGHIAV